MAEEETPRVVRPPYQHRCMHASVKAETGRSEAAAAQHTVL